MTPEQWWESNHKAYQRLVGWEEVAVTEEDTREARAEFIETRMLLRLWARNESDEWKERWQQIQRGRVRGKVENMFMGEDAA